MAKIIEILDSENKQSTLANGLMIVYKTGLDLVGHKIEYWNSNKTVKPNRPFKSVGTVIQYRKSKNKKYKNNYLVEFPPTINQSQSFKMWFQRSLITQID